MSDLVGAKPQEFVSLSKKRRRRRLAVGGRPSAVGGRVGQIILGGRLSKVSSRRSTVGSRRSVLLANFFLSMISLIKNFSGASRRIWKGDIFGDISWCRSAINCCCLILDADMQNENLTWVIRKLFNNTHNFLRFSQDRLLTQISSAVGGRRSAADCRRSGSSLLGSFLLGCLNYAVSRTYRFAKIWKRFAKFGRYQKMFFPWKYFYRLKTKRSVKYKDFWAQVREIKT